MNPSWKAPRLYFRYWRHFPLLTAGSFLFGLIVAVQATAVPLVIAAALNQFINGGHVNFQLVLLAACIQATTIVLAFFLDKYCHAVLHLKVEKQAYEDSFNYLIQQDYAFFADRFSGSLVTQASRFAKAYQTFHDTMLLDVVPQVSTALIALVIMTYYNATLGLSIAAIWLVALTVVVKLGLQRLPLRRGAVAKESEQIGELADAITNAQTIKTFAAEAAEMSRYHHINVIRGKLFLRSWQRAVRNAWIIKSFCAGLQLVVFGGGILAVQHGSIGIATFLLFQVYAMKIIENIERSTMIVRQLEVASGDGQEMAELFDLAPAVQDHETTEQSRITRGSIEFKNMSFHYQDGSTGADPLFDNFNLRIEAGQRIGLVGPSGGGKTTITRVLLRFIDIQSGSIEIDGQDIRNIPQQDLRRAIAYVPQEPLLFHRSIKENIRYGKPNSTDNEIIDAARKSFAHDFIQQLPKGYETLVGERGVKLSGGQRQRVAIARAMLRNAPILVLDEATSALDSESEHLIQKALWELMKGKTAVVIAHRLSTINRMDRIVVLDDGKIIEEGSHSELLDQKGLYAKLWAHQSGGFIE